LNKLFTLDTWTSGLYASNIIDARGVHAVICYVVANRELSTEVCFGKEGIGVKGLPGNRSLWLSIRTGRTMSYRKLTRDLADDLLEIGKIVMEDAVR
jgi:hypothetical protein